MRTERMGDLLIQNGIYIAISLGAVAVLAALYLANNIRRKDSGTDLMREIAQAIEDGAKAYLRRQIITVTAIAVLIMMLIIYFKDGWTAIGFVVGAVFSMAAGYIGMRVAVLANVRTTEGARRGAKYALRTAFNGGAVTGLLVIGLALLSVGIFFIVAVAAVGQALAIQALVGLALGSSLISVFARLGGGIYTKAADVGADLVGKIEQNLDEDDPRNPATIADNVGDNVGDCAGMAADVFETYAVSLIGAVLLGSITLATVPAAVVYPFLLGGISVIGALLGIAFVHSTNLKPAHALMGAVAVSGVVSAVLFLPVTHFLFQDLTAQLAGTALEGKTWLDLYWASLVGLVMTAVVVVITDYYTSTEWGPVQRLAASCTTGHATNIIAGLALGMRATALPVGFIGIAILLAYGFAGLYGVAVAVMAMLSMAGIVISLDAFGPITDNAGGIAVMANLDKGVRHITDELDAVGNTMKAVTKGYAIASAGLAALVLFGSYVEELRMVMGDAFMATLEFSLQEPKVIVGLFIGGLLPFMFTAYSLEAVGSAAQAVVHEVRRQLKAHPGILLGTEKPDYATCVDIVTKAALVRMVVPALLPVIFVIAVAATPQLGPVVLGGLLVGTIVTGLFVAIAMTTSGGAWDNAKKYIEDGHHGGKGSEAHAAAVTGDTVGDPYKDTAGPAINPMIKVANIVAILIIHIFDQYWLAQ
jgi:K(+)-stimulated pyrophosphate-energized sodium pump